MEFLNTALVVLISLAAVGLAGYVLVFTIVMIAKFARSDSPSPSTTLPEDRSMNEGDFHSGPQGYSPNTAYPDTYYGSGGYGSGGQDEGDFNR